MSKNKSFLLLFIFSLLIFIIADFFPGTDWYIRIGPMILTVIIIFLAALFEKKEDEPKETEQLMIERNTESTGLLSLFLSGSSL
ncbi:hypothetical protein [Jeotgalicoccus sp. WY2]|uniref:hypothetical protein n=1 Tax=Jeotgalicoccus sp. WY2 TaxID=2708346 RepID=UPI001BD26F16|nr:hypothetical protein [Jeotgalicoccus sp. WY2]